MNKLYLAGCLLVFMVMHAQADELVYTPVNPAFGGNALNGDWLLANAKAQDNIDDPDIEEREEKTPGEIFNETFERMLVRNTATSMIGAIGGENTIENQVLDFGDYTVIIESIDETTIQITTYDEIRDVTTVFTTTTDI